MTRELNTFEAASQALDRAGRHARPSFPHTVRTYTGNRESKVVEYVALGVASLIIFALALAVVVIGH